MRRGRAAVEAWDAISKEGEFQLCAGRSCTWRYLPKGNRNRQQFATTVCGRREVIWCWTGALTGLARDNLFSARFALERVPLFSFVCSFSLHRSLRRWAI